MITVAKVQWLFFWKGHYCGFYEENNVVDIKCNICEASPKRISIRKKEGGNQQCDVDCRLSFGHICWHGLHKGVYLPITFSLFPSVWAYLHVNAVHILYVESLVRCLILGKWDGVLRWVGCNEAVAADESIGAIFWDLPRQVTFDAWVSHFRCLSELLPMPEWVTFDA